MIHFIDASSALRAWQKHPPKSHRAFWSCVERRILARNFQTVAGIDGEIEATSPACHAWMHARGIKVVLIDARIRAEAESIALWLEIVGDPSKNRRWNDILLVATAKVFGGKVVTEEKWQNDDERRKGEEYKIPEICRKLGVGCTSIEELMKRSRRG